MTRLTSIKAFSQISDSICTAGQPTESEFFLIREAGYGTIINLALSDSPGAIPHESRIVEDLGLHYIHLPVEWEAPSINDALRFFEIMKLHQDDQVFVHCAANKRVSAFIYLYQVLCLGMDAAIAKEALHRIWIPNPVWQTFIERMITQFQHRTAPSL